MSSDVNMKFSPQIPFFKGIYRASRFSNFRYDFIFRIMNIFRNLK